jgi:quercetin dioxygenase-like cupin family protein
MNKNVAAAFAVAMSMTAFAGLAFAKGGTAVLTPAADLKWTDVQGFPGLKMAALDGDPAKAGHFMMKLPAGFSAPLHHHSPDHYVTVVSGTLVLTVDGKETKLPAGSYFSFKGKKAHMTKCDAGADCILFNDVRGKWDVVPEEKAAEKKK